MSGHSPAPQKPDGRVFASYPMPAKIDLLNERPRRESLVEQQLEAKIGQQQQQQQLQLQEMNAQSTYSNAPRIEVTEQRFVIQNHRLGGSPRDSSPNQRGGIFDQQQHRQEQNVYKTTNNFSNETRRVQQQEDPADRAGQKFVETKEYRFNIPPGSGGGGGSSVVPHLPVASNSNSGGDRQATSTTTTRTTVETSTINQRANNNAMLLATELAEKEAKLMREINELHQRPYSPFTSPAKIDLSNEQRAVNRQYQHAQSPSRPISQASSIRSTSADLEDKSAKLLEAIEEIERKPFNPQTMVVEREQWFEYPSNKPHERHLTESKRRVRDFCSLPSEMYDGQDRHYHEENLPAPSLSGQTANLGSVHTTIIRSPRREVDNKSPLPFAFDNFTTKGVRGNIASVGAVEPDRPRAPIYPIVKRTPSPSVASRY